MDFHKGMNSILGAKGVGKSLLIEFMRFALTQESTNSDIKWDHEEKLSKQLSQYGQIKYYLLMKLEKELLLQDF